MNVQQTAVKATYFSLLSNLLLALIKATSGILGNSYALIADAIESFSDIFSSLLVLLGIRYANKPPDSNHPYGHGKIEPLTALVVVLFLIGSAGIIAYKSVQNIITPHKVPEVWTLIVLGIIIAWKEYSYRVVLQKSQKTGSSVLKADAWHHRSDAITSVTAFVGISIAVLFGKGYETADDWAALLASIFIVYNGYLILRPALGEILDEQTDDAFITEIRNVANTVEGIVGTEKCLVRKAGMQYHVDLHAIVDRNITVQQGHLIAHELKDTLHKKLPNLGNVLIHIEPD